MKVKSLLISVCLSLVSAITFANGIHAHPKATEVKANNIQKLNIPGCEITVVNASWSDVRVYGTFDDGTSLYPFNVYAYQVPENISLWYYDYCHSGMYVYVDTFSGYRIYSGWTPVNTTITISNRANQLKAEVQGK